MLKSGGVVIPMRLNTDRSWIVYDKLNFIFPLNADLDKLGLIPSVKPFDDGICKLLSILSKELLKNPESKKYSDIAAFAFWCRKGNIELMKKKRVLDLRLGRGVVLHIAPSNVPVNFAYSMVAGLLAGNINIIRLPTKNFEQVNIICDTLISVLEMEGFEKYRDFITLIKYEKDDEINQYLSSLCDIRIIWGGDYTIREIRKAPLKPRAFDITFADRYSISVINSEKYCMEQNPKKVAQDFYNDTYLFDQNACTSPHFIAWIGQEHTIRDAKEIFWSELYKIVKSQYKLQPVQAVDKLATFYTAAANMDIVEAQMPDNLIIRAKLNKLSEGIEEYRCQGGYFYEYSAESLEQIIPVINQKYQTLSYYGLDKEIFQNFIGSGLKGLDRIVPIGKTLDFSLYWDGYDLISTLSRIIDIL